VRRPIWIGGADGEAVRTPGQARATSDHGWSVAAWKRVRGRGPSGRSLAQPRHSRLAQVGEGHGATWPHMAQVAGPEGGGSLHA
jgi:hypothetical protein